MYLTKNRETGLYSRYFIVPKKDVGLCPILDLRVLNDSIMQFKFKMLTLRQIVPQIRSEDWFVTIDLKDAYLHTSTLPCHRKFLRFAFGGIYQFWGDIPISGSSVRPSIITPHFHEMHRYGPGASSSTGYSHNEPHQRLVDSSLVASVGSPASRCCSCSHERVGVMAKCQKECAFSTTEDHFSWRGMGLNVDAGVPVIDTFRVHPVGYEKYKARPVTHCQTVSETVRSYGRSIQCDTFWTVVHETPAVVAQDQKVFPEGQPLSHDQGYASMLTCLVMWKKPWFLSQGPMFGASCHRKMQTTDASLKDWGAILEGCSSQGLWKDHNPSWHINRLEMLAVFLALKNFLADLRGHHVLIHSDSTSVVSYINHQGGLRSRLHANWRAVLLGLDAMVQTWPRLRLYAFPPIALVPGVLERVRRDRVLLLLIAPRWPGRVWFPDIISLLEGPPLELPVRRDLLSQAGDSIFHPQPELWKLWAWPLRGPSS